MDDDSERDAGSLIADRFRVLETLGEGGMGRVYRVRDESTRRELALKEHKSSAEPKRDQARRVRFRREFHTIARLRHPFIVRAYDYGVERGRPHYTMELLRPVEAEDFRGDVRRTCAALRDLAAALSFLHNRRLVHRDVAIKNVGLGGDGSAKLLDFGMVAAPGTTGEIAGTMPYIAPEVFRGVPLDPRSDIYGLGVLAFLLLSGKRPKPAAGEQGPPPPLSSLVEGVPASLDALVSAMLSPHPLVRPSPADIAEAVAEAADLDPHASIAVTAGNFVSPPLVGRQRELNAMRGLVQGSLEGTGGAAVVEGESGTGKSRIVNEVAVEAQVLGATVVRAHADIPGQRPYGVVQELARAIYEAIPQEAAQAGRAHARQVAEAVPQLGGSAEPPRGPQPLAITNEERLRIQSHLSAWFVDVARLRPLTILIDDLQRCDEPSAAVLAAIADVAPSEPLALIGGFRTDEEVRAPATVKRILSASKRIRLSSLEPSDIDELLRGMFGDTPYLERMATWVHRLAGSRPMHCIGLVRDLVDRSVIRYTDGLWVIPRDLSDERLPDEFAKAIKGWLTGLSQTATKLGQALAVYRRPAGVPLLLELSDADEPDVFAAIDELTYAGVLVGSEDSMRFRHDSYLEAFAAGIGPDELRRLHLRAARLLELDAQTGAEHTEEIGWHLLRGGQARQGARLLERAGRRSFDRLAYADAIPPLVAALEVYREDDPESSVCLELEDRLMKAGAISDRKLAMDYADRSLATMRQASGFSYATRLRPWLGTPLSMLLGTGWALLLWLLRPAKSRGPGPLEAALRLSTAIMVSGFTSLTALDEARLAELVSISKPFRLFRNRVPSCCHLFARAFLAYCRAELELANELCDEVRRILRTDRSNAVTASDRRLLDGAAQVIPALGSAHAQDGRQQERIAALRAVSLPFFDLVAQQLEVLYYRIRGEEDTALELESKAELMSIQLGSAWPVETMSPLSGALAYARTHDVRGLRRCIEELERLVARGDELETFLLLTEATYYRLQGRYEAARKRHEDVAALLGDTSTWVGSMSRLDLGLVEVRAGNYDRAKALAMAEAAHLREGSGPYSIATHAQVIALADAYLGNPEAGRQRLREMIERVEGARNPPALFGLHSAAAEIAHLCDDVSALTHHIAEMERVAAPTRNPALLARVERWETMLTAYRAGLYELEEDNGDKATLADDPGAEEQSSLFAQKLEHRLEQCQHDRQRIEEILETLVVQCVADRGYLFMMDEQGPRVLASTSGECPPPSELLGLDLGTDWQAIPLWRHSGDTRRLAGLAALVGEETRPAPPWLADQLLRVLDRTNPAPTPSA